MGELLLSLQSGVCIIARSFNIVNCLFCQNKVLFKVAKVAICSCLYDDEQNISKTNAETDFSLSDTKLYS